MMDEKMIEEIVQQVVARLDNNPSKLTQNGPIPIAVSARHVHLEKAHIEMLFGPDYELTKKQDLSQPGQFAANETVMIAGQKGSIERVRVLGPARAQSQVEVSLTDAFKLGVKAPLRESGDISDSASITLIGPKGSVHLNEGLIIAQAHIHMQPADAETLLVEDGDYVSVAIDSERPIVMNSIKVRVSEKYRLEMHIDTDEANAAMVSGKMNGKIVRPNTKGHQQRVLEKVFQTSKKQDKVFKFEKRLLSKADLDGIKAKKIQVAKGTIITALANDLAREQEIEIKIV